MPARTLQVRILSPEKSLFEGEAAAVFLPGTLSPFEVLPQHAPIISSLSSGDIKLRGTDGSQTIIPIRGGIVRVLSDQITICTD